MEDQHQRGTYRVKRGLAEMLKGGVIMDVVTAEQARIAEDAGAVAVTPADETHHIDKWAFTVPFVCGATDLGEALRRISEGACMIRSKGEAGTGNIVQAVRHLRSITGDIRKITQADEAELFEWAKQLRAPLPAVQEIAETGELPVPLFCAGGIATPADAALAMQLGAQSVFVGSGIFKSDDPAPRAKAIVEATTHFRDADILAKVSRGLGTPMTGIGMDATGSSADSVRFEDRGW
jgi:pyridoxal 5'-phosphate synthase pdxS subunit